jgi:hypothetical protein
MNQTDETILVFAMRYALGRRTGASYIVSTQIVNVWDAITRHTQEQIQREIINTAASPTEWASVLQLAIRDE